MVADDAVLLPGSLPTSLPFVKKGAKPQGAARQTHFKKLKQMVAYDVELAANERVAAAAGGRTANEGDGGRGEYVPWCPYPAFDAGPSLLPPKKYSDISGLEAPYTDPHTGLRYACVAELKVIRTLSSENVEKILQLRGAGKKVG